MRRTREQLLLFGILGLGMLTRGLHLWAIMGTAFPSIPSVFAQSDLYGFWHWAQLILGGDWLGRDAYHPYFDWMKAIAPEETWYRWWGGGGTFHQAPFYPYWVAGLLAVSRNSVGFVLAVQLLVGALQPFLMFRLAARLFDHRVGLVAAALTALYGPFIFHQGVLLRDWFVPILDTVVLLLLLKAHEKERGSAWLMAGMALGLSYVTKTTALLFVPLALLWMRLEDRGAWRKTVAAWACVGAGLLIPLLPIVARNAVVGAKLFSVSTRGPEGFIIGNASDGDPVGPFLAPPSMKGILERSQGRFLAVVRETLGTYRGDPGRFLHIQLRKLRGIANPYEVPNNVNFYYGLDISPALRFTLGYGLIFPIGVAGLVLSLWQWPKGRLLHLYFLVALIALWLQPIRSRYRLVLIPVFIVFAAALLVWLFNAARQRQIGTAATVASLCLAIAILQHKALALTEPEYYVHGAEYVYSSRLYASEGRFDRGLEELLRLVEKERKTPDVFWWSVPASQLEGDYRVEWAKSLLAGGKREEARTQVEQALAAYAGHLDESSPLYEVGLLYLKLEEPARARAFLERFLRLEPEGARADEVRRLLSGGKS